MNCNKFIRVMMGLLLTTAIISAFPFGLLAQESKTDVEHEAGFYYTIQRGDTLWDLSHRFFDTPWLWPELWHENKQIPNPHWIYPGERIRLFQHWGKDSFSLIPPPAPAAQAAATPVAKELPYFEYTRIDSVGFIRKEAVRPHGVLFQVQGDKKMLSESDTVYIRPADGVVFTPGSLYTVYRTLDPTDDKKRNAVLGKQYLLVGIVKIASLEDKFALATIVRSFQDIHLQDLLIPYQPRAPKVPLTPSPAGLTGHIITAESHTRVFGDHFIVFIDKGAEDQVAPGQRYTIYYQDKEKSKSTDKEDILLSPVDVGSLLVLHTEAHTATTIVTSSNTNISPGAFFRSQMQ